MAFGSSTLVRSLAVGALCVLGSVSVMLFSPLPGATNVAQAAVGKGLVDYQLEWIDTSGVPVADLVKEIGPERLNAKWTRVLVHWRALEPQDGEYNQQYIAQLDGIVAQFRAAGVNVIFTSTGVPKWASDSSLWGTCKEKDIGEGYYPFYAMRVDDGHVMSRFEAFGHFLAQHYAGQVKHFEVWNEPNLWSELFPQNLSKRSMEGPKAYLKMLRAFSEGVREGASGAVVIAGATAPRGTGNAASTAPQTFAKYLKSQKALSLFGAYSHHPYTPEKTRQDAPGGQPNNPQQAVILGNLSQITKLFPTKPFYLTEYGYSTQDGHFGAIVSKVNQARYLRQAYSYVKRYKQVKALLWYDLDDWPLGTDGVYTGLRTATGERKLSWYAFAGHNKITLSAPAHARRGVAFKVTGVLKYRAPDPPVRQKLMLQARTSARKPWVKVAMVNTQTNGKYSFSVKQSVARTYRVVWDGVVESAGRTVRTP